MASSQGCWKWTGLRGTQGYHMANITTVLTRCIELNNSLGMLLGYGGRSHKGLGRRYLGTTAADVLKDISVIITIWRHTKLMYLGSNII